MAFSLALRRAASAAAPFAACTAVKAVAATQTFHSSLLRALPLRNILPLAYLSSLSAKQSSSDSDADLLKVLDSEIKFASEDYKKPEKLPKGFPFEIEDEKGTSVITLRRSCQREEIEIVVSMPNLLSEEGGDDNDDEESNDNENDDEGEGAGDGTGQFSIPLTVNISKEGGMSLEVGCTAYPDDIEIDAVSLRWDRESEGEMIVYEGPQFNHLDEKLQKALHKYLEMRGISPFTINLLYEYMINKDNREYLFWLKNLRRFMEE